MKKILYVITCVSLCFGLVACSETSDVKDDAMNELVNGIVSLKDMNSMNYDVKVDIHSPSSSSKALMSGSIINLDTIPQLSFALDLQNKEDATNMAIEYYMTKDTTYINLMGIKQKYENSVNISDLMAFVKQPMNADLMKELIKPYIKTAVKEGNILTLEVDCEKLKEIEEIKQYTNNMVFDSIQVQITMDDGFIASVVMNCATSDATTKEVTKYIANANILDVNSVTTIKFPDFSSYKEMPSF